MTLAGLSVRRPVATVMMFVAIGVLGAVSFTRLPIDLLPDVSFPTLSVWTEYTGAAPAEVEQLVTEPVERVLSRIPGARSIDSRSREGQSLVRLEFDWGTDMEYAMLHVRERLDNLSGALPQSAERPVILTADPTNEPIMSFAVTGAPLGDLRDLAEAVFKRRLEQLDGVALATITGDPERQIHVEVDPRLLAAHGVSLAEVTSALDAANYSAPGGSIRRGRFRFSLRTLGEFRGVEDLAQVTIARPEEGGVVRLGDVARIFEGQAERETIARFNGEPAIGLLIYKESGSNTVRVADDVQEVLDQLAVQFPEVTVEVATNQAVFISAAISNVVSALVQGGILAFLVLFVFLRDPRYPVAIGLAIPISILAAFALCYLFDVSLNIMSLGGLALGVGMLVDNSIVVLENIFRLREEKQEREEVEEGADTFAADTTARGADEVAGAITASTLTTIVVFAPVLYVAGVAGALFGDLSLTVAFSLLASLLVALTLLPVMAARFAGFRPGPADRAGSADRAPPLDGAPSPHAPTPPEKMAGSRLGAAWRAVRQSPRRLGRGTRYVGGAVRETFRDIGRTVGGVTDRLTRPGLDVLERGLAEFSERYQGWLAWALDHRGAVLAGTLGCLLLAVVIGSFLPLRLMPNVDEGTFRVELALPVGAPLEATSEVAGRLEEGLLAMDGVEAVFTRVGRARETELATRELSGLNSAAIEVRLAGGTDERELIAGFRRRLPAMGVDPQAVSVERGRSSSLGRAVGAGAADLSVRVRGENLDSLIAVAGHVATQLGNLDRIADPRVDMQLTQPVLEVEVDRVAAARFGFTVQEVADAIESYLRGVETDRPFTEFSKKIDILVSLPAEARDRLGDVLSLTLRGVPIGQLVTVRETYGPVEIRRLNQNRTVQVLADVRSGGLADAVDAVEAQIAGLALPPLTAVSVGGQNEEMQESFRSLFFAFGLALFLVFLLLAAEFESLVQPIVVMMAVPLAGIGAIFGLALAGGGLNAMSGIGMVILVGIADNNAVVAVDFINQQRAAGASKRAAILEAGRMRLRPILMTTITTMLGLAPMALGWGAGADLRAPLAVVLIWGLAFSTVLTLIVVPVTYSMLVAPGEPVSAEAAGGLAYDAYASAPRRGPAETPS